MRMVRAGGSGSLPGMRFISTLLCFGLATACGGDPAPTGSSTGGGASPLPWLPEDWDARYRFDLPDVDAPELTLGALLDALLGEHAPPGLPEVLDFWVRSAAPPELSRFLHAWNGVRHGGLEARIAGEVRIEETAPGQGVALDRWLDVEVWAACASAPARVKATADDLFAAGLAPDGGGPYSFRVETSSGTPRLRALRQLWVEPHHLRRLRGRAAVSCAGGVGDLRSFLEGAVPCADLAAELGPLGDVAERACVEGTRQVADWLEGEAEGPLDLQLELDGVGLGDPPSQFTGVGLRGLGLRASPHPDVPAESWRGVFEWEASSP